MVVVTVTTLDEDTAVTQTFCVHLPTDIIQMDTCEEAGEDEELKSLQKKRSCHVIPQKKKEKGPKTSLWSI